MQWLSFRSGARCNFHSTVRGKKRKKERKKLLFSVNSGSTFISRQNFPNSVWNGGSVRAEKCLPLEKP